MSWVAYALLSPLMSSICNFLDKFIVKLAKGNYKAMPFFAAAFSLISSTIWWAYSGFHVVHTNQALLLLVSGFISICGTIAYFKSMTALPASKVIILMQMVPLLVLLLSSVVLGERIGAQSLFGFFLVLISATGLAYKPSGNGTSGNGSFNRSIKGNYVFYIIMADLFWAISGVITKFVSNTVPPGTIYVYQSWGIAIGSLLLLFMLDFRNSLLICLKSNFMKMIPFIIVAESFFNAGKVFNLIAVSKAEVTLVSVLGSTQAFFGILLGAIVSWFGMDVFDETRSGEGFIKEIVWAGIMFYGVYCIY